MKPAWIAVESETRETCNATPVFWACTRLEIMAPQRARTPFLGSRDSSAPKLEVHYMHRWTVHPCVLNACIFIDTYAYIHTCMHVYIHTYLHPACLHTYILTHVVIYMHGYIVTRCLPSFLTFSLPYFLTSLLTYCLALHCIASHYITLIGFTHAVYLWESWEYLRIATITWALDGESGDNRAWPADSGAVAPEWATEIWTCDHWDKDVRTCTPTTIHHHLLPKYLLHLLPLSLQIVRDSLKSLLEKPVATTKWCHSHVS